MDNQVVGLLLVGVAIVGLVLYWVRSKRYPGNVDDDVDIFWLFHRATELVETYAPAADQLVKLGELKKEDRLDYVISIVMSLVEELDWEQVRGIVEAWVAKNKQKS